jgi:hypothetical protein
MSRCLHEYWKSVADPSWPNVDFWSEFVQVDPAMQQECWQDHALLNRLAEIENSEYWHCHSIYPMYRKENTIFVNVPKCGYVHYRDFFLNRLGWELFVPNCYEDFNGTVIVGLMMDPYRRYLKGITEFLWATKLYPYANLDTIFHDLMFPDMHCYPVSQMLGTLNSMINWIPFELMSDHDVKSCMNSLFEKKSSTITIPLSHPELHKSSDEKLQLYEKIKQVFFTHDMTKPDHKNSYSHILAIHRALIPDAIFYRDLAKKFTLDWQHLN